LHRSNVKTYLNRLAADCGFGRLADLNRESLEKWLVRETTSGRSARFRNTHRASVIAFANWCSDPSIGRLSSNPYNGVPKADEKADPRRRRRSMTEAELVTLLDHSETVELETRTYDCREKRRHPASCSLLN
jgi:hypothetical protein